MLSVQASALNIIANSFYLHWIYAGAVGGIILFIVYLRFFKSLGIRDSAAVLGCSIPLWNTLGGYVTVKAWAVVFFLAGARYIFERALSDEAAAGSRQRNNVT